MDMLQHFEDNFNLNVSNEINLANFLRVATQVRKNFNDKFGEDGGFEDPADTDPYEEEDDSLKVKDFSKKDSAREAMLWMCYSEETTI
jgi:hypothetical protein